MSLFAPSLLFPAFYVGETREPYPAIYLLLIGWLLGSSRLYFAWFLAWSANAFLVAALVKYNKPKISVVSAVVALVFALSFLGYDEILGSEAPPYPRIEAYGWGYFLWVASIGYLCVVEYSRFAQKSSRFSFAASTVWLVASLSVFSLYYFFGEKSQFAIEAKRNSVFDEKCKIAGETIFRHAEDAKGVFFDPDWETRFKKVNPWEKVDMRDWYNDGVGSLGLPLLNGRYLLFYETRNDRSKQADSPNAPFRRFVQGDHRGREVSRLESAYAVVTKSFDIPRSLNTYGAEVTIRDLRDDSVLARTAYIFDQANGRFCGHARQGHYSTTRFIFDTLNLSRK